ncbi:DMT family transporter [Sphingomonas montanisoli]|uniref:DMT family transporter n=1 Tax=Sphingomonas montanisoli TaxID=2606412 RepID=A0A5D9C5B8_9SPHN|nr:DMT family transporter [Sphingomonas montanisoli]TZG26427.1 DMT family transporter [Sphingomonas montanisoli]
MSSLAPPAPVGIVPTRVILPFIIVTLIWGSTWTAIRYQIEAGIDPFWSIGLRFSIAAAAIFAYGAALRQPLRLPIGGYAYAIAFGSSQFFLNFVFVYEAERYVTSGVVAMFFALLIIPNAILGRIFLKASVGREFIIGSLIAGAGLAMLFAHEIGAVARDGSDKAALGIGYTMIALIFASFANVSQGAVRVRALPPLGVLAWGMTAGATFAILVALVRSGLPTGLTPLYLGSTLYLGLAGSALTFPLYFFMLRQIGPARAAYTGVAVPVIAMILSTILEGYRWSMPAVIGSLLALGGLVIAMRARKPA